MILDYVLNECQWTPEGVICPNADVASTVHRFLREAILDRHMYVCKCIGFEIKSTTKARAHTGTYIARHAQLADSYLEILVKLQDKLFLTDKSCVARAAMSAGEVTVSNSNFYVDGKYEVKAVSVDDYICRVTEDNIIMNLQLSYDCGYRHCANNSRALNNSFFPCNTDFYTGDFFRVLPPIPESNLVRINYYYDTDYTILKDLLSKWYNLVKKLNIRKEELAWMLSFGQ